MSQVIWLVLSQSLWKQQGFSGCINVRDSASLTTPDYLDFFLSLKAKPEHIISILLFLSHNFQMNVLLWLFWCSNIWPIQSPKLAWEYDTLYFFVETNTKITFDNFLSLLLKLRCLMSQMYLLHRIHTNHKETRDVLDGGSECPITAFCFWSHLCQKRCSNKSFCQQSINTQ